MIAYAACAFRRQQWHVPNNRWPEQYNTAAQAPYFSGIWPHAYVRNALRLALGAPAPVVKRSSRGYLTGRNQQSRQHYQHIMPSAEEAYLSTIAPPPADLDLKSCPRGSDHTIRVCMGSKNHNDLGETLLLGK